MGMNYHIVFRLMGFVVAGLIIGFLVGVIVYNPQFTTGPEEEEIDYSRYSSSELLALADGEFRVMRDARGNVAVVCSIENFDPMGVHAGHSIAAAPEQQGERGELRVRIGYAKLALRYSGPDARPQHGLNSLAIPPAQATIVARQTAGPREARSATARG